MITVNILKNKVIIKGHAGYGKKGQDIVCSAVSSLFYALKGYLEKRGRLKEFKAESGNAVMTFTAEGKEGLLMFEIGIKQIADTYPDNVMLYK